MGKLSGNRIRLSLNKIKGLPDNPDGVDRVNYKDIDCPELTLSVMKSGSKIFCVFYRVYAPDGTSKPTYYNLGNALHWSIEEAQQTAREVVKKGREGWDYKKYQATLSRAVSDEKTAEQIDVSLASVGGLPGQLGKGWDDLVASKIEMSHDYKLTLNNTYRKHAYAGFGGAERWLKEISEEECIAFKSKLSDRKVQYNRISVYLNQLFENEIFHGRQARNPLKRLKGFGEKDAYLALTDKGLETLKSVFRNVENFKDHQRNYARYIMILALTGQRPKSIRLLLKADAGGDSNFVDWENKRLVIRDHKTKDKSDEKYENAYLTSEALEILKAASAENPESKFAIPSCDKRERYRNLQISEERARVLFNEYRDQFETEGVGTLTIYNLRHTLATQMLDRGASMEMVAAVLLHSENSRSTSRYARIMDERRKSAVKIIEDIFANKSS